MNSRQCVNRDQCISDMLDSVNSMFFVLKKKA